MIDLDPAIWLGETLVLLVTIWAEDRSMAEPRIQDGDNTFRATVDGEHERGWLAEKWTAPPPPQGDGDFVVDWFTPNVFNALRVAQRWRAAGFWAGGSREPPEPMLE